MYEWSKGGDAFLKVGKTFIRVSTIEVVKPSDDGGSVIVTSSDREFKSSSSPESVMDVITGEKS